MQIKTFYFLLSKTSEEGACKQTKHLYTLQNHILQALVAQLCVQTEREGGQQRERARERERERGDTDNGPQLRKQLGLKQKIVICQHNNCSTGNTQPAKYSTAQTLLPAEEMERNHSAGFQILHHICPCINLSSTTRKQSKKTQTKSVGGNRSESSEVAASY